MTSPALTQALITSVDPARSVLWINAPVQIGTIGTLAVQSSRAISDKYQIEHIPTLDQVSGRYDQIVIFPPRNRIQQQGWIARCAPLLNEGGILYTAQDNKSGSKSLQKDVEACFDDVSALTQSKGRLITAHTPSTTQSEWIAQADWQACGDGDFTSRPGLFAWNKLDKGSALLMEHLPDTLSGNVADFGCGWGALSRHALKSCPSIETLHALDDDFMAIEAAKRNINDPRIKFHWADCTQSVTDMLKLDHIIMNPPFHEGARADAPDLGAAMIVQAAQQLKPKGILWIVANAHLPYEKIMKQHFKHGDLIIENAAYKIYAAKRS